MASQGRLVGGGWLTVVGGRLVGGKGGWGGYLRAASQRRLAG